MFLLHGGVLVLDSSWRGAMCPMCPMCPTRLDGLGCLLGNLGYQSARDQDVTKSCRMYTSKLMYSKDRFMQYEHHGHQCGSVSGRVPNTAHSWVKFVSMIVSHKPSTIVLFVNAKYHFPYAPDDPSRDCPPKSFYMARRSTLSRRALIRGARSEASFEVKLTAMTARETPQARPRASLEGTKPGVKVSLSIS